MKKSILLFSSLALLLCILPIYLPSLITYGQNRFKDYTFTNEELINLTRLIYDTSYPEDSIVMESGKTIIKDGKCGLRLLQILNTALQKQKVNSDVLNRIEELRNTDDLDETYETVNFSINYNDTPGDPDCVYEPENTHPTVVNVQGEPVPLYIFNLGEYLEYALQKYEEFGFISPLSTHDIIVVSVENINAYGQASANPYVFGIDHTMQDISYIWVYSYLQMAAAHELFHHVQYEYVYHGSIIPDDDLSSMWIIEGTARYAEDAVFDNTNDYVFSFDWEAPFHYLDHTDTTLTNLSYEAVLYWKYLTEWHGNIITEPEVGIDLMLALWEEWDSPFSNGIEAVTIVLEDWASLDFEISFREWTLRNYLKDFGNPYLGYDYIEDENCPNTFGNGYADLKASTDTLLSPGSNYSYIWEEVFPWASDYFEYDISSNVDSIYIECDALAGDIFWQVMPVRDSTALLVYESGNANYNLELYNDDFDNIVVIPVGREEDGLYNLYVSATGIGNGPPSLSDGSVSPTTGTTSTLFTYEVTYSDPDGDEPAGKYVFLDNNPYEMEYVSGSYSTGAIFRYEAYLEEGNHTYYFVFNDGFGHEVRFPPSGHIQGPYVGPGNSPPTLTDGLVSPDSGYINTTFTYEVTYSDPEGDEPTVHNVYIDNVSHNMSFMEGNYTSGAVFEYETTLIVGQHNFYFLFNDGHGHQVWLPTTGYYSGPVVENIPPPDTLWTKTFGGSNSDLGFSVQQTYDNGFIIAGWTQSFGSGYQVYLIKTNETGDEIWSHTYDEGSYAEGYCVQQTSDLGYIVTGTSGPSFDVYLIKTDEWGNEIWSQTYSIGWERGESVMQTNDGGYIIGGFTDTNCSGEVDVYVIKTNEVGDEQWSRTYGGNGVDLGRSIQQTLDGGYIIVGYTSSYGAGGIDVYLIKTDNNGMEIWSQTYGGIANDYGYGVQQMSDGGYIIVGATESYSIGYEDVYLIKTDGNGMEIWSHNYGGAGGDCGLDVKHTFDGGFIISGYSTSFSPGNSDVYVIKTDEYGEEVWWQTIGNAGVDVGESIQQTIDGGYIIGGSTCYSGASPMDVYLVRLEEEPMYITNTNIFKPYNYSLKHPYPNPFNPVTNLSFSLQKQSRVLLVVYNIEGKQVTKLVDNWYPSGEHKILFDASDLSSGLYIARLIAGDYTQTQKLLLIK